MQTRHLQETAERLFDNASANAGDLLAIGRKLEEAGKLEAALALYRRLGVAGSSATMAQAWQRAGGLLVRQGKQREAIAACETALRSAPSAPGALRAEIQLDLARLLLASDRKVEARSLLQALASSHDAPELAETARLELARLSFREGNLDTAGHMAAELATGQDSAAEGARQLLAAIGQRHAKTVQAPERAALSHDRSEKAWPLAKARVDQADWKGAAEILRRIVDDGRQQRYFVPAVLALGKCERELERPREAVDLLRKELLQIPLPPLQLVELALLKSDILFVDLNQPAAALDALPVAVPGLEGAPPLGRQMELQRATILLAMHRAEPAHALLARLAPPGDAPPAGPPGPAERLLAEAAAQMKERTTDQASTLPGRVKILMRASRHRDALRVLARALREQKSDPDTAAWCQLQTGRCHNALGEYREALAAYRPFEGALRSTAWADDALLRAAVIQVGPLGDPSAGRKTLERLLQQNPRGDCAPRAMLYLALLDQWQGHRPAARAQADRLVAVFPGSSEALHARQQLLPFLDKAP